MLETKETLKVAPNSKVKLFDENEHGKLFEEVDDASQ